MKIDKKEMHTIFQGIANKNEEYFNQLFKKYQNIVYAVAFAILKNKEDSEEIVQNVFAKIWNMKKENLPTTCEASWLYTLTKNETLNFLRNKKCEISIEELYDITEEENESKKMIGQDAYYKIISKLEPKEQEIVSLKVISELSFKEIANLLNMPIGTVQWKYYKSIKTLKLLITNLSIFIITIGMFIVNRMKKSQINLAEKEEIKVNNVEDENNRTEGLANTSEDNTKVDENVSKNEVTNNEVSKQENTITNNEVSKQENIIANNEVSNQENTITKNETSTITQVNENNKLTNADIGILSISSIFFIFTIIFLIIFLKHQQKAKKKVSK